MTLVSRLQNCHTTYYCHITTFGFYLTGLAFRSCSRRGWVFGKRTFWFHGEAIGWSGQSPSRHSINIVKAVIGKQISGQSKLTTGRIAAHMDGSVVFARWRQRAPRLIHVFQPTRVLNPNGILIGSAVFAGLTTATDRTTDHAT